VLINAAGSDGPALAGGAAGALPLERIRGQISYLPTDALPVLPLVVCRDAYITPPSFGVVSLGASYDSGSDTGLRAASQQDNVGKVADMLSLPGLGQGAPLAGRVGFRSVAPDRLPLVGALPAPAGKTRIERLRDLPRQPGLYGLLGYASRGLTWAPLAAELLAATLENEPLPLELALVQAIDPGRFQLAVLRRNNC
jgi:tRNA 5-methylaminomethyl-2-thiouridine biosynthesis bifunctional protein